MKREHLVELSSTKLDEKLVCGNLFWLTSNRWHLRFNPKKCGVLVVGQKRREKKWRLGKDRIKVH